MHPVRKALSLPLALALVLAFALPTAALAKDLLRIRTDFVNTGVEPSADGKAEFRIKKKNRMRFKVEAEDLQPANYDVVVDGVVRGVLDVRQQPDGEIEGEIEFDTKREPGKALLNFDPRGKLVRIERSATVYLQVVFPNS